MINKQGQIQYAKHIMQIIRLPWCGLVMAIFIFTFSAQAETAPTLRPPRSTISGPTRARLPSFGLGTRLA